jgi:hypothetical protein
MSNVKLSDRHSGGMTVRVDPSLRQDDKHGRVCLRTFWWDYGQGGSFLRQDDKQGLVCLQTF